MEKKDLKKQIALYTHSGSGNHGCEAIADTLGAQLTDAGAPSPLILVTNSEKEDRKYHAAGYYELREEQHIAGHFAAHTAYYLYRRLTGDRESFLRYRFRPVTGKEKPALAVSIGGDNYCYSIMTEDMMLANSMFNRQGTATVLAGCSVEPDLLKDTRIVEDMKLYRRIIAREHITYEALKKAGIPEERLRLIPDPAFTLPVGRSAEEADGNTVGINLSPLVEDYARGKGDAFRAYRELIRHIITASDRNIALIPHVVWDRSNDLVPLRALYEEFSSGGRVRLFGDAAAREIKAAIAGCRLFIGARTHSTIAAYSLGIPTLVLGYSVKAKGIAEDIFGTSEHYVLPIQTLSGGGELIRAYEWLSEQEEAIRSQLMRVMPGYVIRAEENGRAIMEVFDTL